MNIVEVNKLVNMLFESNDNPVINNEVKEQASDFIQYYNKPGIIVALIKGDSECGVQQIPIGAVDNFRFMKVTDENALSRLNDITNENETTHRYQQMIKDYEKSKQDIFESWRKGNVNTFEALKRKYGDKLIGTDIIQNDKKIQHKEKDDNDDKGRHKDQLNLTANKDQVEEYKKDDTLFNEDDLNEGIIGNIINKFGELNRAVDNWSTEKQEKIKQKIGDVVNSPFTKGTVKKLITAYSNANKDIQNDKTTEEDVVFKIKSKDPLIGERDCLTMDLSKKINVKLIQSVTGSDNYMTFFYDTKQAVNNDENQKVNIANVRKILQDKKNNIKRISRDIHGILAYNNSWEDDKQKTKDAEADETVSETDLTNTGSAHIKSDNAQSDILRPVIDIEYDSGKHVIWIIIDKNKIEKEQQKKNDELFT